MILFVLTGTCGAGKSTIIKELSNRLDGAAYCCMDSDDVGLNWWDYAGTDHESQYADDCLKEAVRLADGDAPAMEIHCETPKQINDKYRVGDHLRINRGLYTHHGLYVGNGQIIHYSQGYDDIPEIREVPFAEFAGISKIDIVPENESPMIFPREVVAERARSRLGEKQYNLVFNNCETFVRWCRAGA